MGPESRYLTAVHRKLHPDLHKESMSAAFSNGRPDRYYDGPKRDFWIEWKAGKKLVADGEEKVRFTCTTLQINWVKRRFINGGNAYFVVGDDAKNYYVMQGDSIRILRTDAKKRRHTVLADILLTTNAEGIARWIESFCFGRPRAT